MKTGKISEQTSREQLPESRHRQVERRRRISIHRQNVERERGGADRDDHPEHLLRLLPEQEKQKRPRQVVLLLDTERPEMQQRLELRGRVEVACLAPQGKVGNEARARGDVLAELRVLVGQQDPPAEQQARRQHQDQRRKDPPHPPPVEIGEGEALPLQVLEDDPGDQVARDDEEDVDAGKAAGKGAGKCVVAQHRQDRDRAQPVDVRAISVGRAGGHGPTL